jgi:hypothetical protein
MLNHAQMGPLLLLLFALLGGCVTTGHSPTYIISHDEEPTETAIEEEEIR